MKIRTGIFLGAILGIAAFGGSVLAQNVYVPADSELPTATVTPSRVKIDHSVSAKVALKRAKAANKIKKYEDEGKWYSVAAEKGNAEGQYRYGLYLYDAAMAMTAWEWTQKDQKQIEKWDAEIASGKKEGQDWLQKASAQGYKKADEALAKINSGTTPFPPESSANGSNQPASEPTSNAPPTSSSPTTVEDGAAFFQKGTEAQKAGKDDEAFQYFNRSADLGNADGENSLGLAYSDGKGAKEDNVEAVKWLQKAADQGHVMATGNLGMFYLNGWGVNPDEAKAVSLVRKAGDAYHEAQLGYHFYGKNRFSEAIPWFQKAADQDPKNSFAQLMMGLCYADGKGVGKDLGKAKYWYQLASANGDQMATNKLSDLANVTASSGENSSGDTSNGTNTSPSTAVEQDIQNGDYYNDPQKGNDEKKAIEWYTQAANLGSVEAKVKLGDLYEIESVAMAGSLYYESEVNDVTKQALYWFQLAANQGNEYAARKAKELQEDLQKPGN